MYLHIVSIFSTQFSIAASDGAAEDTVNEKDTDAIIGMCR